MKFLIVKQVFNNGVLNRYPLIVVKCVFFVFSVFSLHTGYAQTVYEPLYRSVYPYLERISQRGIIELHDVIQPISRKDIAHHLHDLDQKKDQLTPLELKELAYYKKEYIFETNILYRDSLISDKEKLQVLTWKSGERPRLAAVQSKNMTFNVQPILGLDYTSNQNGDIHTTFRTGFWVHGYIRKNLGFSLDYRTNLAKGEGIDYERAFVPEQGVIGQKKRNGDFAYTDLKASISYDWDWGTFTVAKDVMPVGYGAHGKMILSDKAPSFPMIRLDVQPLKWLAFNYAHIWLNSDVVDSSRIRYSGSHGRYQVNMVPKKMAIHSLIFYPFKGLSLTIGESVIYNDEVKIGYLLPVSFFRSFSLYDGEAEAYNTTMSNAQFFGQISSRNHIPNTHLYASLFIDEMSLKYLSTRNQSGWNLGVSLTDFPLKNLTVGIEYAKVLPYAYIHHMNSLGYQSAGYNMGHWIGTNADQLSLDLHYRIIRGLELSYAYRSIRKGSEGNFGDQLTAGSNNFGFLWGDLNKVQQTDAQIRYEVLHDFFVRATYRKEKVNTTDNNRFTLSLSYGF